MKQFLLLFFFLWTGSGMLGAQELYHKVRLIVIAPESYSFEQLEPFYEHVLSNHCVPQLQLGEKTFLSTKKALNFYQEQKSNYELTLFINVSALKNTEGYSLRALLEQGSFVQFFEYRQVNINFKEVVSPDFKKESELLERYKKIDDSLYLGP